MLITIRLSTKADAELIADMSRQTFYDSYAAYNTKENMDKFLNEVFTKDELVKEVGAPGNIFLLACFEKTPVGYLRLREAENPPELGNTDAIELARIYTLKEFIGKGIGSALMKKCVEVAKQLGRKVIWLCVWEHNQKAIDFYTRWGFEKFSNHDFVLGNDVQNDWLMKKNL